MLACFVYIYDLFAPDKPRRQHGYILSRDVSNSIWFIEIQYKFVLNHYLKVHSIMF